VYVYRAHATFPEGVNDGGGTIKLHKALVANGDVRWCLRFPGTKFSTVFIGYWILHIILWIILTDVERTVEEFGWGQAGAETLWMDTWWGLTEWVSGAW
jgi:hypothetical protein